MSDDPRRILQDAAERRVPCELLPRGGGWHRGTVMRVEKGGVVVQSKARVLRGGEDVRVWLAVDGRAFTFEASVIRAGVPVPDRSQDGLMLGFITGFEEATEGTTAVGREVALLPPSGPPVPLNLAPVRLVELGVNGLAFTAPSDFHLVFVEGGELRLRLSAPGRSPVQVGAKVSELVRGEGYLLYALRFSEVDDPEAFRELVGELQP